MKKLFGSSQNASWLWEDGGERPKWYIANPLSRRRMHWEIFVALLILYGCIEIPFTVAFLSTGQV